ncbi:hypothetical protein M8C21_027313 [Ambrosia artemisiifolia]|uniref:Uncharacterized protein n=1 Tax=Ambrosia artemisiifolia TaxID=4212 RepID=A0AAD5GED5_AMBAR|nr:hypothetical protein M8C21_027313 [Ambrosia artemisiifolia]
MDRFHKEHDDWCRKNKEAKGAKRYKIKQMPSVVGEVEAIASDLKSIMEEEKAKRRQIMQLVARSKFSESFTRVTMVHFYYYQGLG